MSSNWEQKELIRYDRNGFGWLALECPQSGVTCCVIVRDMIVFIYNWCSSAMNTCVLCRECLLCLATPCRFSQVSFMLLI